MGPILFLLTILTLLVHIWAESINHMKLSIDSDVKTQSQLFEHRSHNNQMGRDVNASKGKFKTHHHRKLVGDDEAATTDDEAAATDDEAATTDDTAGDDTDLYIDLDLYFVVDNWPTDSSEVTSSIESILKTFISTAADVDANDITSFEYSSSIIDTATDDEAATTDDEAATTDDEAATTDDGGRRQLKGYDGHRRLVANYYTLTVTFTLNVIASMNTLVLSNFAAGVTDSILLNQLIADLNADCGCSDYSDISITDSGLVTSEDNSSNSDNFVYLAFLVLLIIPIAWYYWPVKANRAGINSESSVFKTFSLKELFGKKNNDFKPKSTATSFSVFTTPTTYEIRNVKTKEEMQGIYDALHRAYVSGNKV